MTHPKTQSKPDFIWRWGCLLTCIANIYQWVEDMRVTPADMNEIFHEIKGYMLLDDPSTPSSTASAIHWGNVKRFLEPSIEIRNRVSIYDYFDSEDYYYIARVTHSTGVGSHYLLVIGKGDNTFWCFDPETGDTIGVNADDIFYLHEFRRK